VHLAHFDPASASKGSRMNREEDPSGEEKNRIEAAGGWRSLYASLRPTGRSLIFSLLILVSIVSFILLLSSDSKRDFLYPVYVLGTALAPFFAVLIIIQVSRYRRASRMNEQGEQLRLKEAEFFTRLEKDLDCLLQEVRSRDG
jgi:hypothetical protein